MNGPVAGLLVAGKYTLELPLARGGMGSVWVARHRDLGTAVAIKFMESVFVASADARARFEREAKAAAHLDSLHVVQVQDYGVDRGMPYIVMELLKGEDLSTRLTREGRLSLVTTADIMNQVSRALRKAHELKLVHRDLKPANIFIAERDEAQIVKVLDFGIAKAGGPGLAGPATRTGALIGTLHYMSPEQARRSKDVDHRSDLWSLGVIVYRALTGRLPFPGDEIGDVIVKICADPIPVPSSVAPDLPEEVDTFMARALARNQDERFQSVGEFVAALTAIANRPRITRNPVQTSVPTAPMPVRPADPSPPSSTLLAGAAKGVSAGAAPSSSDLISMRDVVSVASEGGKLATSAAPSSSEPISMRDVLSVTDEQSKPRSLMAPPSSSEPISMRDVVSVVSEGGKAATSATPSPGEPMSFDDSISMVEEAEPGSPAVGAQPAPTLELPTQKKLDLSPAPTVNDGSLSPSLQTLYPRKRVGRVVGTVIAGLLLGLVGLAWWTLEERQSRSAAVPAEPSSPLAHASSESTASPVPVGQVTGEPVVPPSASASQQATAAPPVPTDSAQPRPWKPSRPVSTGEKRILLP